MKRQLATLAIAIAIGTTGAQAQSKLYPQLFDLQDVQLTGGPFLHAQTLNDSILLEYDEGRLMQPYEHEAGLKESGKPFVNWCGDRGLDGHVGGHYLSALAISYASCLDATRKAELKERMDRFVNRLKDVQDAWDADADTLMHGYCGGVPHSRDVWTTFAKGNFAEYWKSWVPLYNLHKTYAGLRDAWVYGGSETAKEVFLKFCDWGCQLVSKLNQTQMDNVLGNEHGGINEMFADAYAMTGEAKYLTAARKYTHKWLWNGMAANNTSILNNVHANTQVPKVIGFERYYQVNGTNKYHTAALNFWNEVAYNRTIAVGGNSTNEWFPAPSEYGNFTTSPEGVETCNSNNMLKLSEDLFADDHNSRFADFFEGTMYNHILSSQNPRTGGYVYFTPARPQHYRVYSQVNEAMWCCVGTGMENHGKYAEFVYAHKDDSLFVNLFVPTTLSWKEKKVTLEQKTTFPYEPKSEIDITKGGTFTMAIRQPAWADGFKVTVNGKDVETTTVEGYACISRKWKKGDKVEIALPMKVSVQPLQNYTDYVAFKYGPILLGAKTGTDNLDGLFADDSRMGHIAHGQQKNLYSAPLLIGDRESLADAVQMTNADSLYFKINGYYNDEQFADLVLQPFSTIHEARYMMYWMNVDGEKWAAIQNELKAREDSLNLLADRTIDYVETGTQQSESDHYMKQSNSNKGSYQGEYWRDATGYFQYQLSTKGHTNNVSLWVRYWGGDSGREFYINVDGKRIATVTLTGGKNEFINAEYPIPENLLTGKQTIKVCFVAKTGSTAGGVYYVRLLMPSAATGIKSVTTQRRPFDDAGPA